MYVAGVSDTYRILKVPVITKAVFYEVQDI